MNEEFNNVRFVYGSLRYGHGNGHWANKGGIPLALDVPVPGFKLYSFGPYPGINDASQDDILMVDIVAYNDETCAEVDAMEGGYEARPFTHTHEGVEYTGIIYVYSRTDLSQSRAPLVENGDWNDYKVGRYINDRKDAELFVANKIKTQSTQHAPTVAEIPNASGMAVGE